MKKAIIIITGIILFLPILLWVILLGYYLGYQEVFFFQGTLFNVLAISNVGVLIYFTYKLITIETIPIWSKLLWFFRFLITGFIAMPFFWYYFILHEEKYARFE
ncbi:MAG: hypothetical protein KDE26_18545 [Bacteroidetes bacterium]|nr:hypothetical protein [Bacteroidota bacterium]